VVPLTEVRLLLFARPQHPLQARATVPRDLLEPYTVFMSDASGDFHALVSDFLRADDMPGPRLEATGSNEGVKRSVMTDPVGLGVLPEYALAEELRAGMVRSVPVSPALPSVRLEAVLPGGARSHPAVLELLEACRAALRGVEGPVRRRTR